jgi:S-adenosylmethionine:tRNA ribosyltransferase-isomerase
MRTDAFDYFLPKELIAQAPLSERSSSRLLVLDRSGGSIGHRLFREIDGLLHENDLLVINDTKVIPVRLRARKGTGGGVDILLVEKVDERRWSCLVSGVHKGPAETGVYVGEHPVVLKAGAPFWTIELPVGVDADRLMADHGNMPLPPYIKRVKGERLREDYERYQTIYAREEGSIAAPTAGLHFDGEVLERIASRGVKIVAITLHIGIGTFFLVKSETVEGHEMHREYYSVPASTMEAVKETKAQGGRVVAVGTSCVRTLETAFSGRNGDSLAGSTGLFIYPGYRFKAVDALITNFHLPRSTPLLLACAFAGEEAIEAAYREAIERRYRFYSYGDAMFIS